MTNDSAPSYIHTGRAILEPAHLGDRPDIAALLEEQEQAQAQEQAREAQVAQGLPTEPQGQQPAVVVGESPKEEQGEAEEEEKAEAGAVAVGGRVELRGLVSAKEHNGKRGTGHPRHLARATAW